MKRNGDKGDEASAVADAIVGMGLLPLAQVQSALSRRTNGTPLSEILRTEVDASTLLAVCSLEDKFREGRLGEIALDVVDSFTERSQQTTNKLTVAIAARRASRRMKGERTDVFLLPGYIK